MAKKHVLWASAIVPLLILPLWILLSSQNLERRKTELQAQWEAALDNENFEEAELILEEISLTRNWSMEDQQQKTAELQSLLEMSLLRTRFNELLVTVPGGSFQRGDDWQGLNPEKNDEMPIHWIEMDSFSIFQREWTIQDSLDLLNAFPHYWTVARGEVLDLESGKVLLDIDDRHSNLLWDGDSLSIREGKNNYPQGEISWHGAAFFCNLLSELNGHPGRYDLQSGQKVGNAGYFLPTEAQWEWAAREANSQELYDYSGSNDPVEVAWFYGNSSQGPQEVESLEPNSLGLYDMSGNLYEWCHDWYAVDYYSHSASVNPIGPENGRDRVIRGGSYSDWTFALRTGFRFFRSPSATQDYLGFRPVLNY